MGLHFPALRMEAERELDSLLSFWLTHVQDDAHGGFIGTIRYPLQPVPDAPKALVLHARILWTFSAAYRLKPDARYAAFADRAFAYLEASFRDRLHGGYYWELHADGTPSVPDKRIYGQSFALYGLSEYYRAFGKPGALDAAISLFELLEQRCADVEHGGYLEVFARDWTHTPVTRRLHDSGRPYVVDKSMNAHLHMLEAYTCLYRVWPNDALRRQLTMLVFIVQERIVHPKTSRFVLFFDAAWQPLSAIESYGHDIEGSWLLCEAAEMLGDAELTRDTSRTALRMAQATLAEGVDVDGGVFHEREPGRGLDTDKLWWPQAEAVVGFFNAYQWSGNRVYAEAALRTWRFILTALKDREHGEWYWRVSREGNIYPEDPKTNAWKCPYHNGRACMELIERLERLEQQPAEAPESSPSGV
ncbi:AGE family epimerase/isomerase [Paenibacillus athensensis]|uniref:Cellobiose 2-epimerase n=1 Tax=Paenibacillus athensensis TaxID=1967502 RepID=A0A4Y8Q9I9_9BACL|nr:AGE family epimerase/isomerase [Paenibacillus athensensis]MCD1258967.1 AGE family epimerase/isomerase [Paenibacillus athensensis]